MGDFLEGVQIAQQGFRDLGAGMRQKKVDEITMEQMRKQAQSNQSLGLAFADTPEGRTAPGGFIAKGIASGDIKPLDAAQAFMHLTPEQSLLYAGRDGALKNDPILQDSFNKMLPMLGVINGQKAFVQESNKLYAQYLYGSTPGQLQDKKQSGTGEGLDYPKPLPGKVLKDTIYNGISSKNPDAQVVIPKGPAGIGLDHDITIDPSQPIVQQFYQMAQGKKGLIFDTDPTIPQDKLNDAVDWYRNSQLPIYKEAIKTANPAYENPALDKALEAEAKSLINRTMQQGIDGTFIKKTDKAGNETYNDIPVRKVKKSALTYSSPTAGYAGDGTASLSDQDKLSYIQSLPIPKGQEKAFQDIMSDIQSRKRSVGDVYDIVTQQKAATPAQTPATINQAPASTPQSQNTEKQPVESKSLSPSERAAQAIEATNSNSDQRREEYLTSVAKNRQANIEAAKSNEANKKIAEKQKEITDEENFLKNKEQSILSAVYMDKKEKQNKLTEIYQSMDDLNKKKLALK